MANPEVEIVLKMAKVCFEAGNHIKALEVIEDFFLARGGRDKVHGYPHQLQGSIFKEVANREETSDLMKFVFSLASVECFLLDLGLLPLAAISMYAIAKHLGSVFFYKKAIKIAEDIAASNENLRENDKYTCITSLKCLNQAAKAELLLGRLGETKLRESNNKIPATIMSSTAGENRLRSYWAAMNVESKRNFMKVSIVKLSDYVDKKYGNEGLKALEKVLEFASVKKKWKFWMCRSCSQEFFNFKKFRNHLEQEHAAKFKPSTTKHMPQGIDKLWAGMISDGGWEPVNAVAATNLIKTQLKFVKEFVYENGWSKHWPLAEDEKKRSGLLKDIKTLLLSFWELKIFSTSIRDWLMQFSVKHLAQLGVSEHTLTTECRLLVETPQIICFLECRELDQMLDLLKHIKCKRDDGTDLISKAVDSLWDRGRVKENIEFDHQFSCMLLDKRLLRGQIADFNDEGIINVCDGNAYYTKTHPQGDDVITWILDCPLMDDCFAFPRSIRLYNLDIWVAVLRAIHYTCRTLKGKYKKKLEMLSYHTALIEAENLCVREDERRNNTPEDQWNTYASLLIGKWFERIRTAGDTLDTRQLACAVRDVLVEALHPTFDLRDANKFLTLLLGRKNLSDDKVLNSIALLKSAVANKVLVVDSKILLVENSRNNMINDLSRLSFFDYRSYILQLLKRFLRVELDEIVGMDAKAKIAAKKELLSEEKLAKEKKPGSKKKKKHSRNKRTSTSMSSLHDQKVEHEMEVTSPSLEAMEEESVEQEVNLSSERGRLETSSRTDKQEEEATKDLQNTPEEDSLPKQLESAHGTGAARCNAALDMTLKALCNITVLKEELLHNRHLFPDNLEEQVSGALQNVLTAFVAEEEGDYSHLLSVLLASLEKVCPKPSHAAEFLVSILEFWPCWKSSERESLVTRLFMLEEYERIYCNKCRRSQHYSEQSSYGIVMAADSIRELKYAFGNIEFEDILKVIRKGDKMLCDIKSGGCGKAKFVHHFTSRRPPIFTIVLEWEKDANEKEIAETTNALNWEIDISRLYEDLEPNTKYRLVSMVGCAGEKEYMCLAYKDNRWFSFRRETSAKEAVGKWENVVKFCGERKVRPEILFYEAFQWP